MRCARTWTRRPRHRRGGTACWRSPMPARKSSSSCAARAGERILDACAGIGGKTAHLLALAGDRARVDALDISTDKLDTARATLRRLGLAGATLEAADLTKPVADPTRAIEPDLLDAPCSGLAVLRRHPEAITRRVAGRSGGARRAAAAACCRSSRPPSGRAVCWCTRCARSSGANARTSSRRSCARTRASRSKARPWPAAACRGRGSPSGTGAVRTWPHRDGADGFFAVRLRLADG